MQRGHALKNKMEEAIGDDAWTELHGPHAVPKKYTPPFLGRENRAPNGDFDEDAHRENLYDYEIEAGLCIDPVKPKATSKKTSKSRGVILEESDNELPSDDNDQGVDVASDPEFADSDGDNVARRQDVPGTMYGGVGGNIRDMRFIRMKIKTLSIHDGQLLQQMIDEGFSLTVALPLADIYHGDVQDQFIKLSNYDIVSENEFEFTSLSLYNFKVSEKTFN